MPSTIPYDPNLTLHSVVSPQALETIAQIANLQAPVDGARDVLESLLASKRSLEMTKDELRNLGVPADGLDREIASLDPKIAEAATNHVKAKLTAQLQIEQLRKALGAGKHKDAESPVDLARSGVKILPLANDSMGTDVRYFSFDASSQNPSAHGKQVAAHVSASVSFLGPEHSTKLGEAVAHEVSSQLAEHEIAGTLVLSVSCTHKNASVVAPFVLDAERGVATWNRLFPGRKFDPADKAGMMKIAMREDQDDRLQYSVVSGITFGSCFVGIVHLLKAASAGFDASDVEAASRAMQASMESDAWTERYRDGGALEPQFLRDIKTLLHQQGEKSVTTVLTMGTEPITKGTAATMLPAPKAPIEPAEIGETSSQKMDINSMMATLDDFLKKAYEGITGVPINYYLKDIDQKMLAQIWVAKHFPETGMSIKHDGTEVARSIDGTATS